MTNDLRKTAEAVLELPDGETLYRAPIYFDDENTVDTADLKALAQAYLDASAKLEMLWNAMFTGKP